MAKEIKELEKDQKEIRDAIVANMKILTSKEVKIVKKKGGIKLGWTMIWPLLLLFYWWLTVIECDQGWDEEEEELGEPFGGYFGWFFLGSLVLVVVDSPCYEVLTAKVELELPPTSIADVVRTGALRLGYFPRLPYPDPCPCFVYVWVVWWWDIFGGNGITLVSPNDYSVYLVRKSYNVPTLFVFPYISNIIFDEWPS